MKKQMFEEEVTRLYGDYQKNDDLDGYMQRKGNLVIAYMDSFLRHHLDDKRPHGVDKFYD
jgi:hypothetical protein